MELIDLKKLNEDNYKIESNCLLVKYGKMILKYGKDPKLFKDVNLPRQLFILLASLLGTDEIFNYAKEIKKEEVNMCESLEYLLNTGRIQGKEEGIAEGKIEGEKTALINNTRNLMETFELTMNQAMDALKIPLSQRSEIESLLVN